MSFGVSRWLAVDDTDAGVQYAGSSWFQDTGSFDTAGNYGPPFKRTMHGTNVDASFSYLFNGTDIRVMGFNNIRNDSGVIDPTYACFVDDIVITPGVQYQYPETNWLFCSTSHLQDGPHNLTVKASVKQGQTFWFDEIIYAPSSTVSLDQKDIIVDNVDPMLEFGAGWQSFSGIGNMTQTPNSIIAFNFTGSSLAWYGFIPGEYPHVATAATYSVDDQSPINFVIPAGVSTTAYNQIIFETSQYSIGGHKIVVKYLGGPTTMPLVLDYFVINNRTSTLPTTATTPNPPASNTNTNTNLPTPVNDRANPSSAHKIAPIIGGALGVAVLAFIAIFAALYFRRWDKMHSRKLPLDEQLKEFIVDPFLYNREAATTIVQPRLPPPPPVERTRTKMQPASRPQNESLGYEADPSSDTPHSMLQSTIDRKRRLAREAEARAAAVRSSRSVSPRQSVGSSSTQLIRHHDSGIRLPPPGSAVEIPPVYTPG